MDTIPFIIFLFNRKVSKKTKLPLLLSSLSAAARGMAKMNCSSWVPRPQRLLLLPWVNVMLASSFIRPETVSCCRPALLQAHSRAPRLTGHVPSLRGSLSRRRRPLVAGWRRSLVPGDGGTSRRVRFLPFSPKIRLTVDSILQSKSHPCSSCSSLWPCMSKMDTDSSYKLLFK
jgi:hypothetical protein